MKSAVFDIETTSLEAGGAGMVLVVCVRPLSTNRTRTFRIDNYRYKPSPQYGFFEREEKDLLNDVVGELDKYDLWIGQNINNFDIPFLRSRAYRQRIPFPYMPLTYDTMVAAGRIRFRTILNHFGRPSKSLDIIADFLGIDQEKTKMYPVEHWKTIWNNESERLKAMNDLTDHCQRDVRMNSQVYDIFLPLDRKVLIRRWM